MKNDKLLLYRIEMRVDEKHIGDGQFIYILGEEEDLRTYYIFYSTEDHEISGIGQMSFEDQISIDLENWAIDSDEAVEISKKFWYKRETITGPVRFWINSSIKTEYGECWYINMVGEDFNYITRINPYTGAIKDYSKDERIKRDK